MVHIQFIPLHSRPCDCCYRTEHRTGVSESHPPPHPTSPDGGRHRVGTQLMCVVWTSHVIFWLLWEEPTCCSDRVALSCLVWAQERLGKVSLPVSEACSGLSCDLVGLVALISLASLLNSGGLLTPTLPKSEEMLPSLGKGGRKKDCLQSLGGGQHGGPGWSS